MEPVRIVGRGVTLRNLVPGDVAAVGEVFDAEVTRFLGFGVRDEAETRAYVEENIALARRVPRTKFLLAIETPGEDVPTLVGTIALVVESPGVASVGFALRRSMWGRGYAGAALEALLGYAFTTLGLHRVWAGHEPDNAASGRVLERAGMVREGTRRQDVFLRDGWRDTVVYAAVAPEWSPRDSDCVIDRDGPTGACRYPGGGGEFGGVGPAAGSTLETCRVHKGGREF